MEKEELLWLTRSKIASSQSVSVLWREKYERQRTKQPAGLYTNVRSYAFTMRYEKRPWQL